LILSVSPDTKVKDMILKCRSVSLMNMDAKILYKYWQTESRILKRGVNTMRSNVIYWGNTNENPQNI
jgi:hypothetical protein